jgi:nitrite reductase (NADH) large subunit
VENHEAESITLRNRRSVTYRKLVIRNDRLIGCVLVGEVEDDLWFLDLIRREIEISAVRKLLIHGHNFVEPSLVLQAPIPRAA